MAYKLVLNFVTIIATIVCPWMSRAFPRLTAANEVYAKTMHRLANTIDSTVDPCQDFFRYTCGNWIKTHAMPEMDSSFSQLDISRAQAYDVITKTLEAQSQSTAVNGPLSKAGKMYKACMNRDAREALGLTPLTDFLAQFGGWPMTLDNWNESAFNWVNISARNYGVELLIAVNTALDDKDSTRSLIYVDQGSLNLPRSFLANLSNKPNIIAAYVRLMTGSAKAIRNCLKTNVSDEQIEKEIDAVLKFESQLATITATAENRRNYYTRMFNSTTVAEFQRWTNNELNSLKYQRKINWFQYLSAIYSMSNVTITRNERIVVVEPDYFKNLLQLLNKTPPRTLANYLLWRLTNAWSTETNEHMDNLYFEFSKIYDGVSKSISRKGRCVLTVNKIMGHALSADYVARFHDKDAITEVKAMIANLKRAFKSLVKEADWVDPATKSVIINKVDSMVELVGHPSWILNSTAMEEYYKTETSAKFHFRNMQQGYAFNHQVHRSSLRQTTDRKKWSIEPTTVDAFYLYGLNSIALPLAMLQYPFYVKDRAVAINYGAIGSVIAHEISHAFDDKGRQIDETGNLAERWSQESLIKYQERAKCFVEQYSNYSVLNHTKINGVNTQGENIADNQGLRTAFRAYQNYVFENGYERIRIRSLTAEQIFFISYAFSLCGIPTPEETARFVETDPHSTFRYRVIGAVSNNEDFVRAFKCDEKSPMNPLNKCVLF